jgi:hypothetical protein
MPRFIPFLVLTLAIVGIALARLVGRPPERVVITPFRGFRGFPHPRTLFMEGWAGSLLRSRVGCGRLPALRGDDPGCVEACEQPRRSSHESFGERCTLNHS